MPKTVEKVASLLEQGRRAFNAGKWEQEKSIHQQIIGLSHIPALDLGWMDEYFIVNFIQSLKGVGTALEVAYHLVSRQGERNLNQLAELVVPILQKHIEECILCQEEYDEGILSSKAFHYQGSWGYSHHLERIFRLAGGRIDDSNPNSQEG